MIDPKDYMNEREQVAQTMVILFNRGLTTVSGGNISLRINEDLFCITPSALDKGNLTADQIVVVGIDGTNYTPEFKLSIESEIHRLILINRPDINAVVHSHPIYASTFSCVDSIESAINMKLTAESYYFSPELVNVPYALMGTKELAIKVSEAGRTHDLMLMQNHGAIALAPTMLKAFDKMDLLERAAQMTVIAQQLNSHGIAAKSLSDEQCSELSSM
ncbi:MAG: class II aldolase/adducin family protein [Sphaerochaeta sp.]